LVQRLANKATRLWKKADEGKKDGISIEEIYFFKIFTGVDFAESASQFLIPNHFHLPVFFYPLPLFDLH